MIAYHYQSHSHSLNVTKKISDSRMGHTCTTTGVYLKAGRLYCTYKSQGQYGNCFPNFSACYIMLMLYKPLYLHCVKITKTQSPV